MGLARKAHGAFQTASAAVRHFSLQDEFNAAVVPGFKNAGVAAGIKRTGSLDMALITSTHPCSAAGLFTQNKVRGASVIVSSQILKSHASDIRAIVINSGCSNAITGEKGLRDAQDMSDTVAENLNIPKNTCLVMSTGVMGVQLPMAEVKAGIAKASKSLEKNQWPDVADAMMTNDNSQKIALQTGSDFTVLGVAKGSSMVHPNMATTLAIMVTDAAVAPQLLDQALRDVNRKTFDCITIDGISSPNDQFVILANGANGQDQIKSASDPRFKPFFAAVESVAMDLAKHIVRDAEGSTKFVTVHVKGAATESMARAVGRTVGSSMLVKTALYGQDLNWKRVLCSMTHADFALNPDKISITFGANTPSRQGRSTKMIVPLLRSGVVVHPSKDDMRLVSNERDIDINIDLGSGPAEASIFTCDLSPEYVVRTGFREKKL